MKDEAVILMVAVDVDDLLELGGAKEVAELHNALNNNSRIAWSGNCM